MCFSYTSRNEIATATGHLAAACTQDGAALAFADETLARDEEVLPGRFFCWRGAGSLCVTCWCGSFLRGARH